MTYKQLVKQARELQEFFTNTYAETALEAAVASGNSILLNDAVKEYASQRHQIEEAEEAMEDRIREIANETSAEIVLDDDWGHDEARDNELSHAGEA